jgi:hypothetical protein
MEEPSSEITEKKCKDCVYYKEEGIYSGSCRYHVLYGASSSDGERRTEFDGTCRYWEANDPKKKKKIDISVQKYREWRDKQPVSRGKSDSAKQKSSR